MKKLFTTLFASVLAITSLFSLAACNQPDDSSGDDPTTVTIQAYNAQKKLADIEVPYDPERIAILDMASLDIIDGLGLGDRVVGCTSVSIEYLKDEYNPTDTNDIKNVGTIKEANMVELMACDPDIIFIGGRLSSVYNDLAEIAPVVYLGVDATKGVVESTTTNTQQIAKIFGKETEVNALLAQYDFSTRINAIKTQFEGKRAIVGMYSGSNFNLVDNTGRCSIIGKECGFANIKDGQTSGATHGDTASWEAIKTLNPEYIFVMDRNNAIGSEATVSTKEAIENEIVKTMDVYKDGKICYLGHPNVWYTSEGGVQALDMMLEDLETFLFPAQA
ncbi:MAG: ABC transporter substrate-binding protein [Clostridia bacterium]|nr:ABC transporter substrate-binding protein [Clostridia bacterium]